MVCPRCSAEVCPQRGSLKIWPPAVACRASPYYYPYHSRRRGKPRREVADTERERNRGRPSSGASKMPLPRDAAAACSGLAGTLAQLAICSLHPANSTGHHSGTTEPPPYAPPFGPAPTAGRLSSPDLRVPRHSSTCRAACHRPSPLRGLHARTLSSSPGARRAPELAHKRQRQFQRRWVRPRSRWVPAPPLPCRRRCLPLLLQSPPQRPTRCLLQRREPRTAPCCCCVTLKPFHWSQSPCD